MACRGLPDTEQLRNIPHLLSRLSLRQRWSPRPQQVNNRPGRAQAEAHYVLTPEKRAKAIAYSRAQYLLYFAGIALSLAIYGFLWRIGFAVVLREWVRRVSARRFVQCVLFAPLFLAAVRVLEFPLDYYWGFTLEHRYDLSTQGFGSWMADWAKDLGLTAVAGIILVWVFYWLVRRSPRRWWLYFWLASIPITLAFILIEPYVVEPLFYRFTPLEKTQPALTDRIEKMLGHAGLAIPRSRIYEMNASAKTRAVNAYVSGLGSQQTRGGVGHHAREAELRPNAPGAWTRSRPLRAPSHPQGIRAG